MIQFQQAGRRAVRRKVKWLKIGHKSRSLTNTLYECMGHVFERPNGCSYDLP
jgi:hypothetical protein